jgi:hypothetical protein
MAEQMAPVSVQVEIPTLRGESHEERRARFIEWLEDLLGGAVNTADAMGVKYAAVWHWKNKGFPTDAAVAVAEVLGVPYKDVLQFADRRHVPPKGSAARARKMIAAAKAGREVRRPAARERERVAERA